MLPPYYSAWSRHSTFLALHQRLLFLIQFTASLCSYPELVPLSPDPSPAPGPRQSLLQRRIQQSAATFLKAHVLGIEKLPDAQHLQQLQAARRWVVICTYNFTIRNVGDIERCVAVLNFGYGIENKLVCGFLCWLVWWFRRCPSFIISLLCSIVG